MKHGDRIAAGIGYSTVLADLDFETYSEAGYQWDEIGARWRPLPGSKKYGIEVVGAAAYAAHPSTEVLSLAYNLKDGAGPRLWIPGAPPPADLFAHIASGGLLEAYNTSFEFYIWHYVCVGRMGWPPLPFDQLRDAMAKARALSLPGKLGDAARVLAVDAQKLDGSKLIKRFSVPRAPTQKDSRRRFRPSDPDQAAHAAEFYAYNLGDIAAEAAVSARCPDLSPFELSVWLTDQRINYRGVHIDRAALAACIEIFEQADRKYTAELAHLTGGAVQSPGEIAKLTGWLAGRGVPVASLDADAVADAVKRPGIPPDARRVLEIRAMLGAASVKKLYAIKNRLSPDGRLRDLFAYYGADRTGRWAGRGPQPQNLPSRGPAVQRCNQCGAYLSAALDACPCSAIDLTPSEWNADAVADALALIAVGRLADVEAVFGDAVATISGCLRGLFTAAPGHDLICSDYSAIEAVVLACLAGEQWRIVVFSTHGKIYEMSAAKISGVPFEELLGHKKRTGDHHPLRNKIGKVAELASGYGGGLGAWKAFGADQHLSEPEIQAAIKSWRRESPAIVNFWYGLERAAVAAIKTPGACYSYRSITYGVKDDILYCRLPSGRALSYHAPRLTPSKTPWGADTLRISYMGVDHVTRQWVRLETYGGKLTENVVQAVSRDILAHALVNVEAAGYPVVLHVHDEIAAEVPEGRGSVQEFERIMSTLPAWAAGWPVKAAGGWRGKRYRKD